MRSCWFLLVMATVCAALAAPAMADGPGVGTPTVVTLGDSAISGEAGRWAGNTNDSYTKIDALGSTAYCDNAAAARRSPAATAPRLHRRTSAAASASANLACSGAKTSTGGTGSGEDFKPGIDFYSDAQGRKGQALALQELRRDAQRQGRRRADRREQLRLRRHRPAVHHRLADVAVVVEELLQRRLGHDVALHRVASSRPRRPTSRTRSCASARR